MLFMAPCSSERREATQRRNEPQLLLKLVDCWLATGQKGEVASFLAAIGGDAPAPLRFELAVRLARARRYRQAIEQFQAIPQDQRDSAVTFNLALAYSHLREFRTARKHYFETIDYDPGSVEAYFRVGLDFSASGERPKAIPWLLRARRMAPERPDIAFALAEELIAAKYTKSAEAILAQSVRDHPNDALLRVAQGDAAIEQKQIAAAVEFYQQALSAHPDSTPALLGLARAFAMEGKHPEARKMLSSVLVRDPDSGAANAGFGRLLADEGDWNAARVHLTKGLQADPDNVALRTGLARCYRRLLQPAKALSVLLEAPAQSSREKNYHLELAQAYRALKRNSEADRHAAIVKRLEARNQEDLSFVPPAVYIH